MKTSFHIAGEEIRVRSKVWEYVELTKPELTFLAIIAALAGSYMASQGAIDLPKLFHTLVATALVGGGVGALNQYLERDADAKMRRTEKRPLPAGKLSEIEVLTFGVGTCVAGIFYLALAVNLLTSFLGVATLVSYIFIYTPLKRKTTLATIIGGVPGAIPPMMGWSAVRGSLSAEAWILFGIVFLWQMPHFFSLSWMYRKDYMRGGFAMLAVVDETGEILSRQIVGYTVAMIPVTLAPTLLGMTGSVYFYGTLFLGLIFLTLCLRLAFVKTNTEAKRLFHSSNLYLTAVLVLMMIDKVK